MTFRVAVARHTLASTLHVSVELVAALLTVRSVRVLAAIDAVSSMSRRLVQLGVEETFIRKTTAVTRCNTLTR